MWTKFKDRFRVSVAGLHDGAATSIPLDAGHGIVAADLPTYFFWYDSATFPNPLDDPNFEWVQGTAIASNTLTVVRAQLGTSATTKNSGSGDYKMISSPYATWFNTELPGHMPLVSQCRLTLESGVPISVTDQLAKTSIKCMPFTGNRVSLIDGSVWKPYVISAELSLALGTLANTFPHDVFMVAPAGTGDPTLELVAWTSNTARASAVIYQDGRLVKQSDPTRLLIGTFKPTSTTATEDSASKRFLSNVYNRVPRNLYLEDLTVHTYLGPIRQHNANPLNQIEFVSAMIQETFAVGIQLNGSLGAGSRHLRTGIGLDSTTVFYRNSEQGIYDMSADSGSLESNYVPVEPQIGYHYLAALQYAVGGAVNYNEMRLVGILLT